MDGDREEFLKNMNWDRSQTIGLARVACAHCHGLGLRFGRVGDETPCNCVFRAIFNACYNRFREIASEDGALRHVNLEFFRGKESRISYGRKNEEYMADFCLISKRSLNAFQYDLFRYHFLLGADWKLCCRRLKMDRGAFFHEVYRIEQKLGRVFRELSPYSLYPLEEYFHGTRRNPRPSQRLIRKVFPIRPPMAPAHLPLTA
jgi:hypothetical protein